MLIDGEYEDRNFITAETTTKEELVNIITDAKEEFYSDDCSVSLYEIVKDMLPEDCKFATVEEIEW